MKILLLLTAPLLTILALAGGEGAEPDIFEMTPQEHMAYIYGPIGNAGQALDQARARLDALEDGQRAETLAAARAAVETGPYEAVTVDIVATLDAQLARHVASLPTDAASRQGQLSAVPFDLADVLTAQDDRLRALAATVASHRALLDALTVTAEHLCCEQAPCCPDNPACEPKPGCDEKPGCNPPPACAKAWQTATPGEVTETIGTVFARVEALDEARRAELDAYGDRVSRSTAALWNSKAALIRYRAELEDLLADSSRIASAMRGEHESGNGDVVAIERRSRLLREDVMELMQMLSAYIGLYC